MSVNRQSNFAKKVHTFLTILLFLGFLTALPGQTVSAQTLDGSFAAAASKLQTPAFIDNDFRPALAGNQSTINKTLVQPDGKILVAGNFHLMSGVSKNFIARFNPDGTLDNAFNAKSGAIGAISAIGLQSDGKIIVGGNFTSYAGNTVGNIARLLPDGSFDVTFNSAGIYYAPGASSSITDISVLPDNRFYIVGNFTSYNGTTINRVARINPNGNIDTTFVPGTAANSTVNVVKQAAGGKILIGGFFTSYNGTAMKSLARINLDGSLDTSFTIGTGPSGGINAISVLPDDKILVGGSINTFNTAAKNGLALLNTDGSNDNTFTVTGTGATINAIARQADGKYVIGGVFPAIGGTTRQSIARLNADGGFDATFNAGTGLNPTGTPVGSVRDLALQADGSVVLVGAFTSYNGTSRSGIARANSSGALDAGLAPTATLAGNIYAISRQADGKVLVGGSFTSVGGTARSNVARLNADGSLDASFVTGTGANGLVESLAVQTDGKIIIGGEFTNYNGTAIKGIARLNADGSLDTSFVVGTGVEGGVLTLALQADGKVLIGGFITTFNSVVVNNIARLNTDGSLDSSFATGTGVNATVRKFIVQPDGKVLVGGDFSTFNGAPKTRLMRLNADGSSDASFNTGTGVNGSVKDMVRHNDGKIVIVGSFSTVNGTARKGAARLNADGSLDTTFDPGVGFTQDVLAITALPDGKYMVGGSFTTASGLPRNRIARLRANGSLDPKFLSGLGALGTGSPQIRTIVPNNGKYLIGGQFETYNTSARSGLLLMKNTSKVPVDFDGDGITDVSIARQYGGIGTWTWWLKYSSNDEVLTFDYGIFGVDGLQPGDFDGDGRTDVAIWRGRAIPGSPVGYWITFSSTNQTKFIQYGQEGDRNVLEDYDGDGKDDMAIYRAPETTIGDGYWIYRGSSNNPNGNLTYVQWGMRYGNQAANQADDIYPGDFDGDGRADFRVQRAIDLTNQTGNTPAIFYTLTAAGQYSYDYFGHASDRGIPGDYDGDGKTDIAISRGFNITCASCVTTWYIRYTGGAPDAQFVWGAGGLDNFVQGDYDGDGTTDVSVYRRAGENNYYIRRSSDQTMMVLQWGAAVEPGGPASDVPIAVYNNR